MLDVNDFTAIRIALASPDQIRSWSYGEITKPETINYRTLKPEKDGLFCEKIFGPTKDFECYCGKYKRVRYKGIICDKCGVEVTRSKVRRERMGHIELASPVAHIWFVKGTPSRLSLLLNISPRSLERVIYFAQYVVMSVDEEARNRIQEEAQGEFNAAVAELQAQREAKVEAARAVYAEEYAALDARKEQIQADYAAKKEAQLAELRAQADEFERLLTENMGQASPSTVTFEGQQIVSEGSGIEQSHVMHLHNLTEGGVTAIESRLTAEQQDDLLKAETEREKIDAKVGHDVEGLDKQIKIETGKAQEAMEARLDDLHELRPLALLSEAKYRELRDKYGPIFQAGMGAEAVLDILAQTDLEDLRDKLQHEVQSSAGQRRKKATKRLRVIEAFRKSGNRPDWMILGVLPVLPPDLRPMVQLDGGRFATSDLNDLYRRVINRNNRLRRLLELGAPDIIIRNEKRMLQEAVDSLIDNGRRGRAVAGSGNHKLKSLSDMLKGKQGRFRQNLLGKRVDYSGRSVIVVGPELQLHQCGLPKRMALEIFKPFVMRRLVELGLAHNIKSAKRVVERAKPEVWDVLEDVIKGRPVLLNRAPTLHRLGIQAFMPVLIEGSAIQIHPLVCSAFNADFDGDQMAVHVPLSRFAVEEAKELMISTHNLLSPSSGDPTVAPTLDMVLGCYYMTLLRPGAKGEGRYFSSINEAKMAYDLGQIDLQAEVIVRGAHHPGELLKTSIGRVLFNETLPEELRYRNALMDRKELRALVADCYRIMTNEETAAFVDKIKNIGFHYATRSGMTIAVTDLNVPVPKDELLAETETKLAHVQRQFQRGFITEDERYNSVIQIWQAASDNLAAQLPRYLDPYGSLYMMANSGAKGNIAQIRQMAGMRGLMSDPSGRIIELPIKSNFREGLSVLEYFISTHGARKGLADTALRTADSGYLTRRLIDVSQDVIVFEEDCGTTAGVWLSDGSDREIMETLAERITGRVALERIVDPATGEVLVEADEYISSDAAASVQEAGIKRAYVRSPLTCLTVRGICQKCYGYSMANMNIVPFREAVGIIAAQSIGEPGTQLTMRTFHTGGIAGLKDITSGLPRVEELFEARVPKGQALISEIDGVVQILRSDDGSRKVRVTNIEVYRDEYPISPTARVLVDAGQSVDMGAVLAEEPAAAEGETTALVNEGKTVARVSGQVGIEDGQVFIVYEEKEEREYAISANAQIRVEDNQRIAAGEQLTEGSKNPQDILSILGREAVQTYLVEEVQKVYRSQGVNINDKHIEVIVRQMLRKVRVDQPGDTALLPGELVDRFQYEEINAKVLAEGGEPATAETVLLGVTKASLNAESFLAAASFQETTRVLTEAAINGAVDRLVGLKENVIIGKLIPAQGLKFEKERVPSLLDGVDEDDLLNGLDGDGLLLDRIPMDAIEIVEDDDEDDAQEKGLSDLLGALANEDDDVLDDEDEDDEDEEDEDALDDPDAEVGLVEDEDD